MDVRGKLVELMGADTCKHDCCEDCEYCEDRDACIDYLKNSMADHLIAHGVTVQEWISVKDRLPEDGEIVLVCGSRGGVYTAVFNKPGQYRGWHKLNSKSHYCDPTHWMPLPDAPQPPKGE